MNTTEPWFMEWVEVTIDGWKLKKEAPENAKKAFKEYMNSLKMLNVE